MAERRERTQIIAEVGANHGGDLGLAEEMIAVAAAAGVDYVKFQSWQAKNVIRTFPDYDATFARHRKAELSDAAHERLIECCRRHGVRFLTTCFDVGRVAFLASLGLDTIKVASPDCGSTRLLEMLRERFPRMFVSTGMTPDEDVVRAAETLRGHDVTFLHCVSLYPTPSHLVNMARMDWLRTLAPRVGFSDHTMGTAAARLAIARGAAVVEKHFTTDRLLPGKDQSVSGLPYEFRELVAYAEETASMLGEERPQMSDEELRLRGIYVGKWGDNR